MQATKRMYNSQAVRFRQPGETMSSDTLVETAGFVSKERKIKMMIAAGVRLENLRKAGVYDFAPGLEPDLNVQCDPTRNKGFDIAEASAILTTLRAKVALVNKQLTEVEKAIEDKEPEKVVEEPVKAPDKK